MAVSNRRIFLKVIESSFNDALQINRRREKTPQSWEGRTNIAFDEFCRTVGEQARKGTRMSALLRFARQTT